MDSLDLIKEKFKNDKYTKSFGVVLDELTEDSVKMYMKLTPEMNNFNGRPHGGAIYGLADAAFSGRHHSHRSGSFRWHLENQSD